MKLKNFIIVADVTNKFKYCSIQKIIVRIMLFKNHLLETISPTRQSSMIQARILNFTLEDITSIIGETTQLTAHITFITDDTEVEVNTGRSTYKVNGKILRDADTWENIIASLQTTQQH